jgi:O-antigen ligase
MSRKFISILKVALAFLGLILCILGSYLFSSTRFFTEGIIGITFQQVLVTCRNPETQWVVMLCASIYFVTFALLQSHHSTACFWHISNPDLWLMGALLVSELIYTFNYSTSSLSLQSLALLAGAMFGKGGKIWASLRLNSRQIRYSIGTYITLLVLLLAFVSIWHWGVTDNSQYRGQARWSGPWDNPNIYGLLMGVGVSLALGLLAQNLTCCDEAKRRRESNVQSQGAEAKSWKPRIRKYAAAILCFSAAILMARGLFHSYSRGAWLATFCGAAYLLWQCVNRESNLVRSSRSNEAPSSQASTINYQSATENRASSRRLLRSVEAFRFSHISCVSRLQRNWLPLFVILLSAIVMTFWHFRQTAWHPAHRAFSVGNQNDFSWRNRLSAWEGALQITAEHPWFGTGWNQPEPLYQHYYLPPKSTESAAIQMNDYLMLGATLGIPALFCFGMYLWLSLFRNSAFNLQSLELLPATCRAGAIVLLVGFWFDGGLFKLATASTFWILFELGAVQLPQQGTESPK